MGGVSGWRRGSLNQRTSAGGESVNKVAMAGRTR